MDAFNAAFVSRERSSGPRMLVACLLLDRFRMKLPAEGCRAVSPAMQECPQPPLWHKEERNQTEACIIGWHAQIIPKLPSGSWSTAKAQQ